MIYLFTLLREDSFREGFNPFLDPSLLAHVVDLILFPETEGQTVEPHFESRDGRKNEVEADRERQEGREKERRSRDTRLYTRSTVFRAPSLSLSLCSPRFLPLRDFAYGARASIVQSVNTSTAVAGWCTRRVDGVVHSIRHSLEKSMIRDSTRRAWTTRN